MLMSSSNVFANVVATVFIELYYFPFRINAIEIEEEVKCDFCFLRETET